MKAIIFDCDGVLVDSEGIYQRAEHKFLGELGVIYNKSAYAEQFMGLPTEKYFEKLRETYGPQLGRPFPEDFETKFKAWCHHEIETNLTAIGGAGAFVSSLRVPYAVASSTKLEHLHRKLRKTDLHIYFDPHIYSGEQVPRGKPFPDLFLHAAGKLAVDPADCVVIEDSANGVRAGVAAGMTVIGFCAGGHCGEWHESVLTNAGAHKTARSYTELAAILA